MTRDGKKWMTLGGIKSGRLFFFINSKESLGGKFVLYSIVKGDGWELLKAYF